MSDFPDVKPIKQLFRHNPPDTHGDCYRTSIAAILGLPSDAVPHWQFDTAGEQQQAATAWLQERGMGFVVVMYGGSSVDEVAAAVDSANPGRPALLTGESRNGVNHCVVIQHGRIVCDPSQDDSGIVGPASDGLFWIEYIVGSTDNARLREALEQCAEYFDDRSDVDTSDGEPVANKEMRLLDVVKTALGEK